MKKAAIVLSKKENNQVVTNMYLDTVCKALVKDGIKMCPKNDISKIDKKKDYLVFDYAKVAIKYWLLGYKNIIIWIQGVVPEEAVMQGYHKYRYYIHSAIEKKVLKNAKFIYMVSKEMLFHYEKKYKVALSEKTFIMPCFNENSIDIASFDVADKYTKNTFLYVGSMHKWQCFEETVKVYKRVESNLKNAHFFVYTRDRKTAKSILEHNHVKNYTLDYVSAKELGKRIRNIKYGFVLRKDDVVNNVATPTKLSNYISHGIIPIYSTCLKSFNDYNQTDGIAIPVDLDNINEGVKRIESNARIKINRKDIENWCKRAFDTYYNQQEYINVSAQKMSEVIDGDNNEKK
ncbi:MAG TPA: hypothetical protein K8V14_10015 [Staphylococcus ureilyticus]|uniref:hypothetical protein n=1 Tax=Staphylococcus ureilyticus TaxID=94138 RepID=UPI001E06A3E2|nr:hypothetical protein [Staphylococcus ureilyticus]HJG67640.1 hypothetical protein [Staphylococcus ureilyticus]